MEATGPRSVSLHFAEGAVMPFQLPRIASFQGVSEANIVVLMHARAEPDRAQLAKYIEWLEAELKLAREAFEVMTGSQWVKE